MQDDDAFRTLMRRVRAGDAAAAAELVRLYEPEVRRVVRLRLTDPRVRRTVDSLDICQSVLANFFTRAAVGQFDLDDPSQLVKLLVTMARNKVVDEVRRQRAGRRDQRRLDPANSAVLAAVADSADSPSQIVAGRELLEALRRQLSDEERHLAEERALGRSWDEIAAQAGGSPEALRKQYTRALDRAARHLGLQEESHA